MNFSSALLTDRYEITMIDAALSSNVHNTPCLFEVFARSLPQGRGYGVVCGTGRLLEHLKSFRFSQDDITYLKSQQMVRPETLDWLTNFQFSGSIRGYREGELYFPFSPILTVEAPFAEGILLETLILSVLNHDCAIASAASRMVHAAHGRPLFEMGSRRAHEHAALAVARSAYITGFEATSNLEAGRTWDIPTIGTASHAFTLIHSNESEAFAAQLKTMGAQTTLLIDTYDVFEALETAISLAGTSLYGVRLDSGDLPVLVRQVRTHLDALGATQTRITVTNDLDEFTIAALRSSPVDFMGVGTSLVTGSGAPTASLVYKLVARQEPDGAWTSTTKKAPGKHHVGGAKHPLRLHDTNGHICEELFVLADSPSQAATFDSKTFTHDPETPSPHARNTTTHPLTVPLVSRGNVHLEHTGKAGLETARQHHAQVLESLPETARSLRRSTPFLTASPTHKAPGH